MTSSSSPAPGHSVSRTAAADTIACDIFCAVIDNFGDIGVCWRLARQLSTEHGWQVRVFVDDLHAFRRLCPSLDVARARQTVDGIAIEHWHAPAHAGDTLSVADVVIEAFACELPPAYLAAMARRERAPVWFNLDYLSGEDWVAEFHLRPSPHPRYPLIKHFFFPGLGPGTGGVLKERDLDASRAAFKASPAARETWWRETTGDAPPSRDAIVVSLFAYENPAVDALLEQWRDGAQPVVLLVPEGRISGAIGRFFSGASSAGSRVTGSGAPGFGGAGLGGAGLGATGAGSTGFGGAGSGVADSGVARPRASGSGAPAFGAGAHAQRGNLLAHGLAFTSQAGYDRLLWSSDVNFVRGEDSFVRAQWAARPFVWHIYPQADDAHLPKLDAALAHVTESLDHAAAGALARFWHAWNGGRSGSGPDWSEFLRYRPAFDAGARDWARQLAKVGDLAGNLAGYAKSQLK